MGQRARWGKPSISWPYLGPGGRLVCRGIPLVVMSQVVFVVMAGDWRRSGEGVESRGGFERGSEMTVAWLFVQWNEKPLARPRPRRLHIAAPFLHVTGHLLGYLRQRVPLLLTVEVVVAPWTPLWVPYPKTPVETAEDPVVCTHILLLPPPHSPFFASLASLQGHIQATSPAGHATPSPSHSLPLLLFLCPVAPPRRLERFPLWILSSVLGEEGVGFGSAVR